MILISNDSGTKKSNIVNLGLQDADATENRTLRVLIGNFEDPLNELLKTSLIGIIGNRYNLKCMSANNVDEILCLAQRQLFHIFILVLNNIVFPNFSMDNVARIKKSLELVKHLSVIYRRPVVALYGFPDDASFAEEARLAGASFSFKIPAGIKDLEEAFIKCLESIGLLPLKWFKS